MNSIQTAHRLIGTVFASAAMLTAAPRADAQWTRVLDVAAGPVYSLAERGDTLLAGVDDAVYVSVDAGGSWARTADLGTPPTSVDAVWIERGRLWAGTYGQGAWTSTDMGGSWQNATAGLSGGLFESHLYVVDFEARGDSLFAGTAGAGTYVKHLGTLGPWTVFGPSLVSPASGGVTDIARSGQRLMVAAESNGGVHFNDRGDPEWTRVSLTGGVGGAGLAASCFTWTGSAWLAATQLGVFRSPTGSSDWQFAGASSGPRLESRIVSAGDRVFLAANSLSDVLFQYSIDGGTSWMALESQPNYVFDLLLRASTLYAARLDGLWRRSVATVGVPPIGGRPGVDLALVGENPVRGTAPLRFTLPASGRARVTVWDVAGRMVDVLLDEERPAGTHSITWKPVAVAPGMHFLRLDTPFGARTVRAVLIH